MLLASASPISIVLRQETGGKADNRVKFTAPPSSTHAIDLAFNVQDEDDSAGVPAHQMIVGLDDEEDGAADDTASVEEDESVHAEEGEEEVERLVTVARKSAQERGRRTVQVWDCDQLFKSRRLANRRAFLAVHLAVGSKILPGGIGESSFFRCAKRLHREARGQVVDPLEVLFANRPVTEGAKTTLRSAFKQLSEATPEPDTQDVPAQPDTPMHEDVPAQTDTLMQQDGPAEPTMASAEEPRNPFLIGFPPNQVAFSKKNKTKATRSRRLFPNDQHKLELNSGLGKISPIQELLFTTDRPAAQLVGVGGGQAASLFPQRSTDVPLEDVAPRVSKKAGGRKKYRRTNGRKLGHQFPEEARARAESIAAFRQKKDVATPAVQAAAPASDTLGAGGDGDEWIPMDVIEEEDGPNEGRTSVPTDTEKERNLHLQLTMKHFQYRTYSQPLHKALQPGLKRFARTIQTVSIAEQPLQRAQRQESQKVGSPSRFTSQQACSTRPTYMTG